MIKSIFSKLLLLYLLTVGWRPELLLAQNEGQHIELGKVNWIRQLDKGIQQSRTDGKPIFILFQEVPGCATCRNYGQNVLSHPLIVEAIESLFVPVAIFNNKGGADAQTLKYFNEPSWNNPVVRIVDDRKKDIIPRLSGNYSQLGVVQRMIRALEKEKRDVPLYLHLLEDELVARQFGVQTTTLSMYCFWTGEKTLGKIEGVVATRPGFMGGREVVEVTFDPAILPFETLISKAKKSQCASHVYADDEEQKEKAAEVLNDRQVSSAGSFRLDKEPKFYLSKTVYKYVPMTPLQAVKANSLVGEMKDPNRVLSPRQIQLAEYFREHPNKKYPVAIEQDLVEAWNKVEGYLNTAKAAKKR